MPKRTPKGRDEAIFLLRKKGKSLKDIAVAFGISRQRIFQIVGKQDKGEKSFPQGK